MKGVYFHFINVKINFVNVRNEEEFLFIIYRYYKIDLIMKYKAGKGYFVNLKNHFLIAKSFQKKESMLFKFINLLISKSISEKIKVDFILKLNFLTIL